MRSFLEALIGAASGAAAGSGNTAHNAGAARDAMARGFEGSANHTGFLREQAAREQALYAEAAMGGQKFKWQDKAVSTCTIQTTDWPASIKRQAEPLPVSQPEKVEQSGTIHPGSYKPVELEAHEDFAVKLRRRPGER